MTGKKIAGGFCQRSRDATVAKGGKASGDLVGDFDKALRASPKTCAKAVQR
ncbi:hypothetical protein [Pleomorphomonas oryzae]|uniref:hypothetical protein n=1 Tax=Pleomorphomonas oryzae TaxID=261934 RepID=UPI001FDF8E94|nr:hypothetical protein [Pleomorphomonas oryzae]